MKYNRRYFIKLATATAAGFTGMRMMFAENMFATPSSELIAEGYGPLQKDPDGIFDLPEGFSYKVISKVGDMMNDGLLVPGRPDGMATFPGPDAKTILICNHELSPGDHENSPFGKYREHYEKFSGKLFDLGAGDNLCIGGTTTMVYDTRTGSMENHFLSLSGTIRNCAGGPTPWNTWVTCEENVAKKEDGLMEDHGYNFEVPAVAEGKPVDPVPLKEMGRFNHEAIAVDYNSGIVYETEDRHDGLIYRYIPNTEGELASGGKLQALVVKGSPSMDTRNWEEKTVEIEQLLDVEWIDLDNVESPHDDLRFRGFEAGAARFARGEGMWTGDNTIYFACTNGGSAKKGQIWKYTPSPNEGQANEGDNPGKLELFVEPNDSGLIDNADNLTVAPWGDLIVCEDGSGEQYLVGITPEGKIYKFGHNALSGSELAGATFSPDGTTLFVNIQHDGYTLAITGPWDKRA